MKKICSLAGRTRLKVENTTSVYKNLARTWSQRRLGNVVLILGDHVPNHKFYTESGADLEEQQYDLMGGSGLVMHTLL